MQRAFVVVLIALVAVGYLVWSYLTHALGDQHVAYTPSRIECGASKSGAWKYCVHRAEQGTNGGVAYLLHGRNLDEKTWNDDTYYTSMIQQRWQERREKPPIVVTVSFGPVWLLTPKNSKTQSGLLATFRNEVLPEIEAKVGAPTYRAVFGESMGGLNSLIVGLSSAGLFQKVAALCPGVYKASPFSSFAELKQAATRTGAEPLTVFGILSLAKSYAANEEEWSQIDPLRLADRLEGPSPEFYISAPLYDKYGNFEGTEALAKKLDAMRVKTSWRPIYGGHCAIDVVSLADFLL